MASYAALNLVVLAGVLAVLRVRPRWPRLAWWVMLGVLLGMTALFDTLIIAAGIVAYDETKLLGWYVGRAPVEDFAYALLAACIIPLLWRRQVPAKHEGRHD